MKVWPAPLLVLLVSCAGVRAPAAPCPGAPAGLHQPPAAEPVKDRRPECRPIPPIKIVWMPPGCPPEFGACLSGMDAGALVLYLQATRLQVARCSDGR